MLDKRNIIARNIAKKIKDGQFINLGVGMPTLVGNYISPELDITLHGENGTAGLGEEFPTADIYKNAGVYLQWQKDHSGDKGDSVNGHKDLVNAGGNPTALTEGACCFDSAMSFGIIRGGHLDVTVIGGLQVDQEGNLANWMVPGKRVNGMGGAMDLVACTKQVIVAMEHCDKKGRSKIVRKCDMPLTGVNCVDYVVTELCVMHFIDNRIVVEAMAPGITKEELQQQTEAELHFADSVETMEVD